MSQEITIASTESIVFTNQTVTTNSSVVLSSYGVQQINLVVNITAAPTGTNPTIQFTIQEVDPGDDTTAFGTSSSTILISSAGVYTAALRNITSDTVKVSWVLAGTSPSFTGVYATLTSKISSPVFVPQSGHVQVLASISVGGEIAFQGPGSGYSEQTTNAKRSISSANASDAAAGTGVRQVKIVYYDQNCNGPFSETVTMNGTTAVNTVNTNICFVESMTAVSVGSGGKAAGAITLFIGTGGTGGAIGSMAINSTIITWGHHYVANGKTCYIDSMNISSSAASAGQGAVLYLRSYNPTVSTSPKNYFGGFARSYWSGPSGHIIYPHPISITGPAALQLYVFSDGTNTTTYWGGFSWYEP